MYLLHVSLSMKNNVLCYSTLLADVEKRNKNLLLENIFLFHWFSNYVKKCAILLLHFHKNMGGKDDFKVFTF